MDRSPGLIMPRPDYPSPRWSGEITDCSMPMTFDTYSPCSYNCHYCFSLYQRDTGVRQAMYRAKEVRSVNPAHVRRIFAQPESSQFCGYVKARMPMQWGGLSDQFDEYERKYGVTLGLLRFFRDIEYPICFSTKAAWWAFDERYMDCFRGAAHFNTKFSLITLDETAARHIEAGCPTPAERLAAMAEVAKNCPGGVTLRLRPYLIGLSNKSAKELIRRAADAGATALSTEFFCLERRSREGIRTHYPILSRELGFDVLAYYLKHSSGSGYLRLTRDVKRPYVEEMQEACQQYGLRFYVSDAHFKERCANGSCCGLPETWNYNRGQDCEALLIAKRQGEVTWADLARHQGWMAGVPFVYAHNFNNISAEKRAKFWRFSMSEYLHYIWNHPQMGQSPYRQFEGIVKPSRRDAQGDLVYVWDASRA